MHGDGPKSIAKLCRWRIRIMVDSSLVEAIAEAVAFFGWKSKEEICEDPEAPTILSQLSGCEIEVEENPQDFTLYQNGKFYKVSLTEVDESN